MCNHHINTTVIYHYFPISFKSVIIVILLLTGAEQKCSFYGDVAVNFSAFPLMLWGGRVVRWCWVNFQCRGVLLIRVIVGQGPTALAVGAGGGCLHIFFLLSIISLFLSPSLWETARYRLKYCLKGPLSPNQPTNHLC